MKKSAALILIFLYSMCNPFQSVSQFITWHWSVTEGDALNEYIIAVDCDADGNFYVTGNFQGTFSFFGETLTSNGDYDVFVARFDPNGNMIWVKQGGGEYEDGGRDIYVDDQFVYVTGGFVNQAVFEGETLVSDGARDMFLLKYDLDGSLQWAVRGGSVTDDAGNSVTVDDAGNIYLTGDINYTATFGDHTVPHYGFTDLFVAKYDGDGICQWAKSAGGSIYDYGGFIETVDDHLFVSGAFNDVAQFDTATVTSVDFVDIFIAHYLTDGSLVEVISAGGTNNENIGCMAVDSDLNVYIGGWYMLDITIGDNSFSSNGGMDIFIAKFEPGNGFAWASSYGGIGDDEAQAISIGWIADGKNEENNSFIIAGTFENEISFPNFTLLSDGFDDGFILQHDSNGTVDWATQIGGAGTLKMNDCFVIEPGICYFVGDFVDELKIGNKTYNPVGGYDLFIAMLGHSIGINDPIDERNHLFRITPNPVKSFATISFNLDVESKISLDIYDQNGEFIQNIINRIRPKGEHNVQFDISDLPQGVYLITMKTGEQMQTQKMIKLSK